MQWRNPIGRIVGAALLALLASPGTGRADDRSEIQALRREIEALRRSDAEKQRQLDELRGLIERLQPAVGGPPAAPPAVVHGTAAPAADAPAAAPSPAVAREPGVPAPPPAPAREIVAPVGGPPSAETALDRAVQALPPAPVAQPPGAAPRPPLLSRAFGSAQLKLIDVSMVVLSAAGGSSVPDSDIRGLEAGAHDPSKRGFTLQQAELSFTGAVDPYFTAEAHVVGTTGGVELEEAFFTTLALPYDLQLEGGYFFTEFGRINPRHPHAWDWIDQPVINSRLFGGEGLRAPGVRLGWLTPLPWFSELHVGAQNPNEGELTTSFLGEEGVGGRPVVKENVDNFGDVLYLARWNNSVDVSDSVTGLVGFSGLFGPNVTGGDARTYIYGLDMLWKWQPPQSFRGWPFLTWQTEVMKRDYTAADFVAGTAVGDGGEEADGDAHEVALGTEAQEDDDEDIPGTFLRDYGFYTQLLWGFRHPWAIGLRYEYATGSGDSLDGRSNDFLRDDRHRLSPLIVWHPSEFSRIRLQYNYDRADFLDDDDAHSVWLGVEVLYGAHPAHQY